MSAAAQLTRRLTSLDAAVRKAAAQALVREPDSHFKRQIEECLVGEQLPGVAKWLALALSKVGDGSSQNVLREKLKTAKDLDLRDWIAVSLGALQGDVNSDGLLKILQSNDSEVRLEALRILYNHSNILPQLKGRVLTFLEDPDPHTRRWACIILRNDHTPKVIEALRERLTDPDALVREWAEYGLAEIKDEKVLLQLLANTADPQPRVREWAVKALAPYGSENVVPLLVEVLKGERDEGCVEAIVMVLARHLLLSTTPLKQREAIRLGLVALAKRERRAVVVGRLLNVILRDPELSNDSKTVDVLRDQLARNAVNDLVIDEDLRASAFNLSRHIDDASSRHSAERVEFSPRRAPDICDAIIVIALSEEFEVFRRIFNVEEYRINLWPFPIYKAHLRDSQNIARSVYVVVVGQMGGMDAAMACEVMLMALSPTIIINIGIAAGVARDLRLGDVVLGTEVYDYLYRAKITDREVPADSGGAASSRLAKPAAKSKVVPAMQIHLAGRNFTLTPSALGLATWLVQERLQPNSDWSKRCNTYNLKVANDKFKKVVKKGLARMSPKCFPGKVASGPFVCESEHFLGELRNAARDILCLEMESAGCGVVAERVSPKVNCLTIRGISDFGDSRKKLFDDSGPSREIAMSNATRAALALLSEGGLQRLEPHR